MLNKVIKIGAFTAIAALGVTALIKSDLFPKLKEKLHNYDVEFEKKNCIKRRLQVIADVMQKRIKEIDCRTSCENHKRRQEEYDKMNWDEKKISRKAFS